MKTPIKRARKVAPKLLKVDDTVLFAREYDAQITDINTATRSITIFIEDQYDGCGPCKMATTADKIGAVWRGVKLIKGPEQVIKPLWFIP